jgi:hypothetical protein
MPPFSMNAAQKKKHAVLGTFLLSVSRVSCSRGCHAPRVQAAKDELRRVRKELHRVGEEWTLLQGLYHEVKVGPRQASPGGHHATAPQSDSLPPQLVTHCDRSSAAGLSRWPGDAWGAVSQQLGAASCRASRTSCRHSLTSRRSRCSASWRRRAWSCTTPGKRPARVSIRRRTLLPPSGSACANGCLPACWQSVAVHRRTRPFALLDSNAIRE